MLRAVLYRNEAENELEMHHYRFQFAHTKEAAFSSNEWAAKWMNETRKQSHDTPRWCSEIVALKERCRPMNT